MSVFTIAARIDACVFRWLGSHCFDRKDFIELKSQVLLGQRLARELSMRVLADVTREDGEKAARQVAGFVMIATGEARDEQRKIMRGVSKSQL